MRVTRIAVLCLLLAALPAGQLPAAEDAAAVAAGRRIYMEGILPSGKPLISAGQAGVSFSGAAAACSVCHRRSGFGSSEGPVNVRSITGPALFGERVATAPPGSIGVNATASGQAAHEIDGNRSDAANAARAKAQALAAARSVQFLGERPRPAYDNATLARAIRTGVDVLGKPLDASMPRYDLDDESMAALTAYLRTLSVDSAPGVTADAVHMAIVIQPGVDAARRKAVVSVVEQLFEDTNAGQRDAVLRERTGQVRMGHVFRPWQLHVWQLQGPSSTWDNQLRKFYAQQPVFALVSGVGDANWAPIHEFSERTRLPCILPQTDVPLIREGDFYTVYLNRGMTLEAQVLAQHLHDEGAGSTVVQVSDASDEGRVASAAFRAAWQARGGKLKERTLSGSPGEDYWRQLSKEADGASVVLWLSPASFAHAGPLTQPESAVKSVYLSSGMGAREQAAIPPDSAGRLRLIYPENLPDARKARIELIRRWLQGKGIAITDEEAQSNAYLAATVAGMVVSHSKDAYSRELMLERIEHRLGNSLELSIYPHLSLGPGQRFASKGSYIVQLNADPANPMTALSDWIVP